MKNMIKLILRNVLFGAAVGCVIFVILGIVSDISNEGSLVFESFTTQAIGAMIIGVGFAVSSVVYHIERLPLWLQICIQILVAFGTLLLVGLRLGSVSFQSPITILSILGVNALIGIAIGFGGYMLNFHEAKVINAKIRERESQNNNDSQV